MKGSDAKKGKHRQWLAGAVFSAALVGTCLLLFLLSDAGAALLAALGVVQTVYEPAPVSTALPETTEAPKATAAVGMEEHPALSAEAFLQRAESFGMETPAALSFGHERMAEYTLAYCSGETATLLLSLQNGEVTEFMLTMRRPMPPASLAADANWFLQQEHDARQAQYEESLAWVYQAFLAYALALDGEEALPYSEAAQMADAARSTFEDGEARTAEHGKFRFIYSILYKPCIFKVYRLLNVQTLCIFPCFCPYEPKQGKFFILRRLPYPAVLRKYASLPL